MERIDAFYNLFKIQIIITISNPAKVLHEKHKTMGKKEET